MTYSSNICNLLILFFLIKTSKSEELEKNDMQLRYDACYKLIQIKLEKEKNSFKRLSQVLFKEEINNILQYTLFECYQTINYYEAEEIDSKNPEEINIYQRKYIDLLNYYKWEKLIKSRDEITIRYALEDLQEAYNDIKSGFIKINPYQKNKTAKPKSTNEDEYKEEDFNYYDYYSGEDKNEFDLSIDMDADLQLFGINFSNLSSNFKNILGFGLMIIIIVCIVFGLKLINNIRNNKEKQNKEKGKKDKKEKKKKKKY